MTEQREHNRARSARKLGQLLSAALLALTLPGSEEAFSKTALTNEPAAMVEYVVNGPDGLSNFDYVYPGHVIDLGTNGALSLIYFQHCIREEIRGGQVTIQEYSSDVREPIQLSRTSLQCGNGQNLAIQNDRRTSAAMVFRGQPKLLQIDHSAPCFQTSGKADWLSIVEARSALEIFLIQRPEKMVDLSRLRVFLKPGQIYHVRTNDNTITVRIAADAKMQSGSEAVSLDDQLTEKMVCENP